MSYGICMRIKGTIAQELFTGLFRQDSVIQPVAISRLQRVQGKETFAEAGAVQIPSEILWLSKVESEFISKPVEGESTFQFRDLEYTTCTTWDLETLAGSGLLGDDGRKSARSILCQLKIFDHRLVRLRFPANRFLPALRIMTSDAAEPSFLLSFDWYTFPWCSKHNDLLQECIRVAHQIMTDFVNANADQIMGAVLVPAEEGLGALNEVLFKAFISLPLAEMV